MGEDGTGRRDGLPHAGANDLGGTLMDEKITRSAGAVHGQEMTPDTMEADHPVDRQDAAPAQHDLWRRVRRALPHSSFRAAPSRLQPPSRAGIVRGRKW